MFSFGVFFSFFMGFFFRYSCITMNVYWLLCFDCSVPKRFWQSDKKGTKRKRVTAYIFILFWKSFKTNTYLGSPFLLITIIYVFTSTDQSVFSADHGFTFVILNLYMVNTDTNENEASSLRLTIYYLSCVSSTF